MINVTETAAFWQAQTPAALVERFGSPLYVYSETMLRARSREMAALVRREGFKARFAAKANLNPALLRIVREEGLWADATSQGEVYALFAAGYKPEEILFTANNVSSDEMRYAVDNRVLMSLDSLSQVEAFGRLNPGGEVAARLNTGVGAGHHEKVVTGGDKTKFGITPEHWDALKGLLRKHKLRLVGINQHIGSLFMEDAPYLQGAEAALEAAKGFEGLRFIDLGGGFGIPYRKQEGQPRLPLDELGGRLDALFGRFAAEYGPVGFHIEPGRYVCAECGVLLGTVHAVKANGARKFIGTDVGFPVLARPMLYDAYHEIEVYNDSREREAVTVVGNICESGDIIAKERLLPVMREGDVFGVLDAGAYGFAMASNYNNRQRPAEVLIQADGAARLIRRRDTFEDMLAPYRGLYE